MYNSFRVIVFTKNQQGGETEYITRLDVEEGQTVEEVKQAAILKFHSECDKYGSNPQVAYCTVKLFDMNGGQIRTEDFSQPAPSEE